MKLHTVSNAMGYRRLSPEEPRYRERSWMG